MSPKDRDGGEKPEPDETEPEPDESETEGPEAEGPDPEGEQVEPGEEVAAGRSRRLLDVLVPAIGVLVLVAGLVTWWRAGQHDADEVARAEERDRVLITATSQIETMNTLDYRDVEGGLKAWADITTGTLHDQIVEQGAEEADLLADQKKISQGHVVQAAVLDLATDSATVIAAVEVTVQDGADLEAEPTVKRHRYSAELVEVDGDWLLESLEQVAVSIS